ncbi:MAG: SUMF1/EgtB/PvdO family nonheme iron enzyme [Caldilineaceae bacterium]|nr:SUMF1/EgtB/PvdO family nonheme iron enzyme [Caldilineaceae bacterium]
MPTIELIANTLCMGAVRQMQTECPADVAQAYQVLLDYLQRRYPQVELEGIQRFPDSKLGQASLLKELTAAHADQDPDLLAAALTLLDALRAHADAAPTAQSIGVDLEQVEAARLHIFDVIGGDLAVRVRNSRFAGEMHIGRTQAGDGAGAEGARTGDVLFQGNQADEIHVGDKIGGDKVGGDKFDGDKVGGDKVGGDKVGGDKVGGDKVLGNKYVGTTPQLDLSKLEVAYLKSLYAECNELPLAHDGPVDQTGRRSPRLQRVYVDLDIDKRPTQQLVQQRLAAVQVDVHALRAQIEQLQDDKPAKGRGSRTHLRLEQGMDEPDAVNWELLNGLSSEALEQVATALQTTPDALQAAFVNMTALEAIGANPQLVILGDPGGGKSTLTRRLAGVLASGCQSELDEMEAGWLAELDALFGRRLLPVRVVLSRWAAHLDAQTQGVADDLITECVRILQQTASLTNDRQKEHFLERLTGATPNALILLDGLDEVADGVQRATLLASVADFCRGFGHVPLIVTCRIRPYAAWQQAGEALALPDFTLAPLSRAAVGDFIERWHGELVYAGRYQPEASAAAKGRLLGALDDPNRAELRHMAGTPLLLTMMARVNHAKGLPNSRAMLYEEYVAQLLWEWERTKLDEKGRPTNLEALLNGAKIPKGSLENALNRLAYSVHNPAEQRDTVDISHHTMRDALEAIHPGDKPTKAEWVERVLALMDERTGLIYAKDDRTYHFSHRTFQEYLAARQMTAGNFLAKFRERIDQEAWREAIYLALGYQIAVHADYDNALAVFDELMPRNPTAASEWQHVLLLGNAYVHLFGPLLAGQAEQKRRAEQVIEMMPRLLTAALQNGALPPAQRLDAGSLLAHLSVEPPGLDDFVAIPGQPFKIGRYPVTNGQFRRFVADGGYQDDRWWSDAEGRKYRDDEKWTAPRYWDSMRFNWLSQPVVGVSWYEANAYCAWLTEWLRKEEQIGTDAEVRLPTEAQWMTTAHADEYEYPWGADEFDTSRANTSESELNQTTPVHMYADGVTVDGVWDMSGNVYEWSADVDESDGWPWLKGGAYWRSGDNATSAARNGGGPVDRDVSVGFRCVVVPSSR